MRKRLCQQQCSSRLREGVSQKGAVPRFQTKGRIARGKNECPQWFEEGVDVFLQSDRSPPHLTALINRCASSTRKEEPEMLKELKATLAELILEEGKSISQG